MRDIASANGYDSFLYMYYMNRKMKLIFLLIFALTTFIGNSCKKDEKEKEIPVAYDPCSDSKKPFILLLSNIYPPDSAVLQPTSLTLNWTGNGLLPIKFEVFIGTNPDSVKLIGSNLTVNYFSLQGLKLNTKYYWKISLIDKCGRIMQRSLNFKTVPDISIPYVTTSSVPFICSTSAPVGGKVDYEGLSPVTERGVYYGLSANPEKTGTKLSLGNGPGFFSTILTELNQTTTYYLKTYVINNEGIFYGNEITFTTGLKMPYLFISDIEGNKYKYLTLGNQVWMAENLKTTKFNDGTSIPADRIINTEHLFWYNDDSATYKSKYGALYDWYAVNTGKLCPAGWHIPSDSEWKTLEIFLGMTQGQADGLDQRGTDQGNQLKFTDGWYDQGNGFNTSGFSALPAGEWALYYYKDQKYRGSWWSSTESTEFLLTDPKNISFERTIFSDQKCIYRWKYPWQTGLSVRCIKD